MSISYSVVEPLADAIVESLRAIGYSLETAVADIIDNSISAGAKNIYLDFCWAGEDSYIRIEDDGGGMTGETLIEAMRLGSRSPLEQRGKEDLGRFGLGLKTATFSQCRRLTVLTRQGTAASEIKCWDLDFIQSIKKWALINHPFSDESALNLGQLRNDSGTIVLWEKLDKLVGNKLTNKSHDNFFKKVERTEKYLSMVFHRFLRGPRAIIMVLNGHRIKPWDPYMSDELSTQELPEERFHDGQNTIIIKSYILPHHSKLSQDKYEAGDGIGGWTEQQGFYVYRNRRLLVAGDWLGLFRKEESCKLARIMIDITSDMDLAWDIDVKKASAKPPDFLLDDMKRIGKRAREASAKVYYHRGTTISKNTADEIVPLWNQVQHHGNIAVRVNRHHPLVKCLEKKGKEVKRELEALLALIETTMPYGFSTASAAGGSQDTPVDGEKKEELMYVMKEVIAAFEANGLSSEQVKNELARMEPFRQYPELIAIML